MKGSVRVLPPSPEEDKDRVAMCCWGVKIGSDGCGGSGWETDMDRVGAIGRL